MRRHLFLQAYSRLQRRSSLSILIFHRVLDREDPLRPGEPTAAAFESRMRWVKANFNVLPLSEGVRSLREDRLPSNALAITFDDGYADNHVLAAPILARLGLHATFFVAGAFLDGGRMFNDSVIEAIRRVRGEVLDLSGIELGVHRVASEQDRRAAIAQILGRVKYLAPAARDERVAALVESIGIELPRNLMMTSEQVSELHALGMAIGGHTHTHPILQMIDVATAEREIRAGRQYLEAIVGEPITLFAYPNGRPGQDYGRQHVELVRAAGFAAAFSTAWGVGRAAGDPFQLPRFTPWDRSNWRFGLRMLRTMTARGYAVAEG